MADPTLQADVEGNPVIDPETQRQLLGDVLPILNGLPYGNGTEERLDNPHYQPL
jgi:hypothetical protein